MASLVWIDHTNAVSGKIPSGANWGTPAGVLYAVGAYSDTGGSAILKRPSPVRGSSSVAWQPDRRGLARGAPKGWLESH